MPDTSLRVAAQNPNVRAFLGMISDAEGTNSNGYATAFGGGRIPSLETHPNKASHITDNAGHEVTTTAAGRYQVNKPTWDEFSRKVGVSDFSPQSQDLVALGIIRQEGALQDVLSGNFDAAVQKVGNRWASLPTSTADQNTRGWDFIHNSLQARLENASAPDAQQALGGKIDAAGIPVTTNLSGLRKTLENPDWLNAISKAQQLVQDNDANQDVSPWEQQLLQQSMVQDSDDARKEALATFFGDDIVGDQPLPTSVEDFITSISASV